MIEEQIKAEVDTADFVSMIADETTDASVSNQMSLIIRFISQGVLEERFLGFSNVSNKSGQTFYSSFQLWKFINIDNGRF